MQQDYKIKRWKNNLPLKMAGFFWMFLFIMSDFDTKKSVFLVFNENFRIEIQESLIKSPKGKLFGLISAMIVE